MKSLRSERGAASIGTIFFYFIVVVCAYAGFKMATPWVRYKQVEELFRVEVARLKTAKEDEVRKAVNTKLEDLNVSLYAGEENDYTPLRIIFEEGRPAIMEATYMVDVDFIGGYRYTYTFNPRKVSPTIINPRDN